MNIPEEAIEAAAVELFSRGGYVATWNQLYGSDGDQIRGIYRGRAIGAIKAAAPIIAAQALREAAEVWGDSTWQDVWAEDDVDDDVTAVQSTVKWIKARADKMDSTP